MKRLGVCFLLVAGVAAGCENQYEAITAPPPGLTASLDDGSNAIRLSRGASIAFECTTAESDPCARVSSTDSASTALIFPASLDSLTEWGYEHGPQPRTAFVVVGIAEGKTSVEAGGESLTVTVLP
jgi:hypothetical protein